MVGNAALADARWIGSRGVQKRSARASGAIHDIFGEPLEIVGIVVFFVANDVHETAPATTDADDFVAFTESTESNRANCGIQAGHVAAPGQNSDHTLLHIDICHVGRLAFEWSVKQTIIRRAQQLGKGARSGFGHESMFSKKQIESMANENRIAYGSIRLPRTLRNCASHAGC